MPENYKPIHPHPHQVAKLLEFQERTRQMNEQLNNRKFWESQLTAKVIAERAKAYKVWLFDPADKQWYSPEEFEDVFSKLFAGNPLFKRMQFKDPLEGITAGFIHLDQTKDKLMNLISRVVAYYKNEPPPPNPAA